MLSAGRFSSRPRRTPRAFAGIRSKTSSLGFGKSERSKSRAEMSGASDGREWIVYTLSHPITHEIRYVGVTHQSEAARLNEHICHSKRDKHHRATWIRSLVRQGLRPRLTVIERGIGSDWVVCEQRWIAYHRSIGTRLTNATDGGEGTLGWVPSPERREKMAEVCRRRTGEKRSSEAKERMRQAQLRVYEQEQALGIKRVKPPPSEETRRRMSEAQRGKKASEETRAKMREQRKDVSEETRAKLRAATLSRPEEVRQAFATNQKGVPKSEEHRRKIAEAATGRTVSEETRQKLREANLGKAQSEESRRKKSESCRLAWERKKSVSKSEPEAS